MNDGLVDDIKEYPGYNCFEDAIHGRERLFKVVRWKDYHDAKRRNPQVSIEDFTDRFPLRYARLPGYDKLTRAEYVAMMRRKLRQRTKEALKRRGYNPSIGPALMRQTRPGSIPKKTKTSGPKDHRPRVLSKSRERRGPAEAWYFNTYFEFKECSKRYRAGELDIEFPPGTYKPPFFTVAFEGILL